MPVRPHPDFAVDDLKSFLGRHPNLRPGQLHKEEVFSLLIRAGRKCGFTVKTETSAPWAKEVGVGGNPPASDIGWFDQGDRLIAVFEIDGRDAPDGHFTKTTGNRRKLAGSPAVVKVQVLYSVKNDLTLKPPERRARQLLPSGTLVITDEELMSGDGLGNLMRDLFQRAAPG